MTPFQQDQLLDQVRANGNWVESVENGLTLDGHFQLADLRKLALVLEARMTPQVGGTLSLKVDGLPSALRTLKAAADSLPKGGSDFWERQLAIFSRELMDKAHQELPILVVIDRPDEDLTK